jgi:hypothetical protein
MIFVVQRIFFPLPTSVPPGVFRLANNMLVVRLLTEHCMLPSREEIFNIRQHCVPPPPFRTDVQLGGVSRQQVFMKLHKPKCSTEIRRV